MSRLNRWTGTPAPVALKRAAAVATVAAVAAVVPATAQSPATPAPGCAGMSSTDPTGDASRLGAADAPPNFDITGLFFNYREGKTFVTMTVAGPGGSDLPAGATGARWYIFFTKGGNEFFVRAGNITPNGESFEVGHTDPDNATGQYVSDGETQGRFGDGFLEMVIPSSLAKVGEPLGAPLAQTFERIGNQLQEIDVSNSNGKPYTPAKCEQPGAGDPATNPPPSGTPAPTTPPPGPAPGPSESKGLQVAVPASAKAKGKKLALKVSSNGGTVTAIKAVLKKGAKTVGKGSLAKLNGKGTLKLKLSKKLKKGAYKLDLSGKNPDGQPATRSISLKLK